MSTESQQAVRDALLQTFNRDYGNIIAAIHKLPLHPQLKAYAFQNLDQGMFWVKEAINQMQFDAPSQPVSLVEAPAPIAPEIEPAAEANTNS